MDVRPSPNPNDIRAFMIVSAGNNDVTEVAQFVADFQDFGILQANEINRHQRDLLVGMFQHDTASP